MSVSISEEYFGTSSSGEQCSLYTLQNASGIQAKITNFGATLVALNTFDKRGYLGNVCLGFDTLKEYEAQQVFIGAVVGRYANRIANARFSVEGQSYQLEPNLGMHTLHGGATSLGRRVWRVESACVEDDNPTLTLKVESQDGESGFPGNISATVRYCLAQDNRLTVSFLVETDKKTPISMTHHAYFNLSRSDPAKADDSLSSHAFEIYSDQILAVDEALLPTGEYLSVDGGVFDFRQKKPLANYLEPLHSELTAALGFDHNYCFEPWTAALKKIARVEDEKSGRAMDILSTLPGAQLYTGNYLFDAGFNKYGAFCIEPQFYPDSPNITGFPFEWCSPEAPYEHTIEWRFSVLP